MEVLEFVWWRFCGRDFSWEYHVPAFCIPNAQLCGQNLPTLEMKIPKTWMCMNRWRAPPYSEGSEDIIICNDCLAYIGTVHVFYVLVVHVYTYFNCTCLFQAAGGILCCALVLPIWLGFRLLPFVWSPSSCCARVSPMLSGVLITCNALRWSWHWHLKPSIHRCSSLEIQWLRDDVSRQSVCVSTRIAKAEWVVETCWKFDLAYKCNGLIAGLNTFETCRVLPFETRLLKLDPFALCDAGASTRKLVAYFSGFRKICRCLSKHRGDATRCAIVAAWPQRKFNMTVGTRLGRYPKISAYKMSQDVTRCYKMLRDVLRCCKMLQGLVKHRVWAK